MDEYHALLRTNSETLIQQYDASIDVVVALQDTFLDEVLPDLQDERNLDPETVQWVREWLQDTSERATHPAVSRSDRQFLSNVQFVCSIS